MKARSIDLGCGHLGNGLVVWNRATQEHGDYQRIAHIDSDRKVTWYIKAPCPEAQRYVESIASGPNMAVSTSQPDQLIFRERN